MRFRAKARRPVAGDVARAALGAGRIFPRPEPRWHLFFMPLLTSYNFPF